MTASKCSISSPPGRGGRPETHWRLNEQDGFFICKIVYGGQQAALRRSTKARKEETFFSFKKPRGRKRKRNKRRILLPSKCDCEQVQHKQSTGKRGRPETHWRLNEQDGFFICKIVYGGQQAALRRSTKARKEETFFSFKKQGEGREKEQKEDSSSEQV